MCIEAELFKLRRLIWKWNRVSEQELGMSMLDESSNYLKRYRNLEHVKQHWFTWSMLCILQKIRVESPIHWFDFQADTYCYEGSKSRNSEWDNWSECSKSRYTETISQNIILPKYQRIKHLFHLFTGAIPLEQYMKYWLNIDLMK